MSSLIDQSGSDLGRRLSARHRNSHPFCGSSNRYCFAHQSSKNSLEIKKQKSTRGLLPPYLPPHEHPVVLPQVSHFMQVPFRTSVKLPHSLHISPS